MKRITLRQARKRARLTQEGLEQQSGVSQAVISKLERGQITNPSWNSVVELAKALNVEPTALKFATPHEVSA